MKLTPVGALAQAARNTGGGERLNNSSEDVWSAETAILGTLDAHKEHATVERGAQLFNYLVSLIEQSMLLFEKEKRTLY